MQPGDLVSFALRNQEGTGTVVRLVGSRVIIRTDSGDVDIHAGNLIREPTPAQIRRRCLAIQRTWSAAERERRCRHYAESGNRAAPYVDAPAFTVPMVREADLFDSRAG